MVCLIRHGSKGGLPGSQDPARFYSAPGVWAGTKHVQKESLKYARGGDKMHKYTYSRPRILEMSYEPVKHLAIIRTHGSDVNERGPIYG